jgi:Rieske Fe-S protein
MSTTEDHQVKVVHNKTEDQTNEDADLFVRPLSRRNALMTIGIGLNALIGLIITVPVLGYVVGPALRKKGFYKSWVTLGKLDRFPNGQTRLATFITPYKTPTDGMTDNTACWVRRLSDQSFQVFAINCAHLGCPVRWFPQSGLFMCPCHGGVYYQDGSRAAGPPDRGMFEYQWKLVNGELQINAGQLPTLSTSASLQEKGKKSCLG